MKGYVWPARAVLLALVAATVAVAVVSDGFHSTRVELQREVAWLATSGVPLVVQVSGSNARASGWVELPAPEPGGQPRTRAVDGGVVVVDPAGSRLIRIDEATLRQTAVVDVGDGAADLDLYLAGEGQALVVSVQRGLVRQVDPGTLQLGAELLPVGRRLFVAEDASRATLWVLDADNGRLHRVRDGALDGEVVVAEALAGAEPLALALAGDTPVVLTSDGVVPVSPSLEVGKPFCAGVVPWSKTDPVLSADRGALADERATLVTVPSVRRLVWVDVDDGTCQPSPVGDPASGATVAAPGRPLLTADTAYVADASSQVLDRAAPGQAPTSLALPADTIGAEHRVELIEQGGHVWLNDLDGPDAALVEDGQLVEVEKFTKGEDGYRVGGELAEGGSSSVVRNPDRLASVDERLVQPPTPAPGPADPADPQAADDEAEPVEAEAGPGSVPQASELPFNVEPSFPRVGDQVRFTAQGGVGVWRWTVNGVPAGEGASWSWSPTTAGLFTVGLQAQGADGGTLSATRALTVAPEGTDVPPEARFRWEPGVVRVGTPVRFQDLSAVAEGSIDRRSWQFGCALPPSEQVSPVVSFTSAGDCAVTLQVTDSRGLTDTTTLLVSVLGPDQAVPLRAAFAVDKTSIRVGDEARFTDRSEGGPSTWSWNFGDGTSSDQNPRKRWTVAGRYVVRLTVTDPGGATSVSQPQVVEVTDGPVKPTAQMFLSASRVTPNAAVTVTDTSFGQPTEVTVDWGDGTGPERMDPGASRTHRYATSATYTVRLTARNELGTGETTRNVVVEPEVEALGAAFSFSPPNPKAGQSVTFTNTSPGGPTSFAWDFGDGATAQVAHPSHAFATPATYTVELVVRRADAEERTSRTVVVTAVADRPVASYTGPTTVEVGKVATFTSTSSGSPTDLQWVIDGTNYNGGTVAHTFTSAGSRSVRLTASNANGSDDATGTVRVDEPPPASPVSQLVADFAFNPDPAVHLQLLDLVDRSTGGADSWKWSTVPGGQFGVKQNEAYYMLDFRPYTFSLEVCRSSDGTCASTTKTVQMIQSGPPKAAFGYSPVPGQLGSPMNFYDKSTATPTNWTWTFDSGGTSTLQNPSFTFTTPGTKTVTLRACWASECSEASQQVEVSDQPPGGTGPDDNTADFSWSANPTAGQPVTFTAVVDPAPVSQTFHFHDSTTQNGPDATFTYPAAGDYAVRLTVCWNRINPTVGAGDCRDYNKTITVALAPEPPPEVEFTWSPDQPEVGQVVQFTGNASFPIANPGACACSVEWRFPDGSTSGATNATFTFTAPGDHVVTLTGCRLVCTVRQHTVTVVAACSLKSVGDADCNGHVTTADNDIWRSDFDAGTNASRSDFNGDGSVSLSDYEIWRRTYEAGEHP